MFRGFVVQRCEAARVYFFVAETLRARTLLSLGFRVEDLRLTMECGIKPCTLGFSVCSQTDGGAWKQASHVSWCRAIPVE